MFFFLLPLVFVCIGTFMKTVGNMLAMRICSVIWSLMNTLKIILLVILCTGVFQN